MIASTHLVVGAVSSIGVQKFVKFNIGFRCVLALLTGVVSHLILDYFPHWEYKERWPWPLVFAETAIVFLIIFPFGKSKLFNSIVLLGMIGAAIPDFLFLFSDQAQIGFLHVIFHSTHAWSSLYFFGHLYVQILISIAGIIYLKAKTRPA